MDILVISPEAGNWTSPSSLTTAVNRMADAFSRAGVRVLTISPFYKSKIKDPDSYECVFKGKEWLHGRSFEVYRSKDDPHHTYIYNDEFFGRPFVYGPPDDLPYGDNHLRFAFLASSALAYASAVRFKCMAIIGHEWGGALVGALASTIYQDDFETVPFFFFVHNITYDFHVSSSEIENIGLPRKDYNMDGYEFWGKVSLLKAGICYAHKVIFPSPGYRDAMLYTNLSGGLSGFLSHNANKLIGVQFGVSYQFWDFNKEKLPIKTAKAKARKELAQKYGADFGNKMLMYVHLDTEAGNTSETLATILADVTKEDVFVLVGSSQSHPDWSYYNDCAKQDPKSLHVIEFDDTFSDVENLRNILAASDVIFAGNLREPSTSILLKALACGCLPVTGRNVGVASMLTDYTFETAAAANAFLVDDANAPHLMLPRIKDALNVYQTDTADWDKVVVNAYGGFHYEWDKTISKYLLIFGELGL
ncbi:MAG: glycogen/starch synthase [Fibrobacter sp.]|jgi:starch synthase|nr:glycogen/starch synthase [Fibrobacter sp.]